MKLRTLFGLSISIFAIACGDLSGGNKYDTSKAYVADSPYANSLPLCISAQSVETACSFATLPLIGMEKANPSIDDIMDRVVVSHDWMGANFRQVLTQVPSDILMLLKGVTAVVIDDQIRPSYYYAVTGAIYLDPANLWLTDTEKSVISRHADFRAGFSDPLSFRSPWRYVLDNGRAWEYFSLDSVGGRDLEDVVIPMANLLYHELAHANDFAPPSEIANFNRNSTPWEAMASIQSEWVSTRLEANWRLSSLTMFALADVAFRGEEPDSTLANMQAAEVGETFDMDIANDFYSFSTPREDVAMLFEEIMMKHHFNIDRDLAFVRPDDQYTIEWGMRNRAGKAEIRTRAEWVLSQILPDSDSAAIMAGLPEPTMLDNVGWHASIVIDGNRPVNMKPFYNTIKDVFEQDFRIPGGKTIN